MISTVGWVFELYSADPGSISSVKDVARGEKMEMGGVQKKDFCSYCSETTSLISGKKENLSNYIVNRIYLHEKFEQREREGLTGQVYVQHVRSMDMTYLTRGT